MLNWKPIRAIHTWIVKNYLPDDDQTELANALFNWKYGTSFKA